MSLHARGRMVGLVGLALALGVLSGPSHADDEKMPKAVPEGVDKIAESLGKDKATDVKGAVADLQKIDLKYPMRLFKTRKNFGYGVGAPGTIADAKKDGIEKLVEDLAEAAPTDLAKNAEAYKQAGLRMAAIAAVAESRVPKAAVGRKTPRTG